MPYRLHGAFKKRADDDIDTFDFLRAVCHREDIAEHSVIACASARPRERRLAENGACGDITKSRDGFAIYLYEDARRITAASCGEERATCLAKKASRPLWRRRQREALFMLRGRWAKSERCRFITGAEKIDWR